jgi:hypothetical protein
MSCTTEQYQAKAKDTIMEWNTGKKVSENLMGTKWKLDLGENQCYPSENFDEYKKVRKMNLLTILSDRILISNLSFGLDSKNNKPVDPPKVDEPIMSASEMVEESYVHLKKVDSDIDSSENQYSKDEYGGKELHVNLHASWIAERHTGMNSTSSARVEFLVDPTEKDDKRYKGTKLYSTSGPRKANQAIKGIQMRMKLNFFLDSFQPKNNITYWVRLTENNTCSINKKMYSEMAVATKCMKYGAGKFSDNIMRIYNNLLMSIVVSKNRLNPEYWTGSKDSDNGCWERSPDNLKICKRANTDKGTQEDKNKCLSFFNCELDNKYGKNMVSDSIRREPEGGVSCKPKDPEGKTFETKCLLYSIDKLEKSLDNSVKQLGNYNYYPQHKNPNNVNISEFGAECNADVIEKIEQICRNKNIGISYRWEPSNCDPSRKEYDIRACTAECSQDNCKSPVLAKEPNLGSYMCNLNDLDKIEEECVKIQNQVLKNPSYRTLFTNKYVEENFRISGYYPENYPYTGCNEAVMEEYLIYIRYELMDKVRVTNNRINELIKQGAIDNEEYSKKRLTSISNFEANLKTVHRQLMLKKKETANFLKGIGQVNNTYNRVKESIRDYNELLKNSKSKKHLDYKIYIFVSFLVLNLLLFFVFFRK